MKAICKISHEQIVVETGGFKRYEVGQEYEGSSFDAAYFEPVGAAPLCPPQSGQPQPQTGQPQGVAPTIESESGQPQGIAPTYKKGGKK